jgi:hypothetical protein
MASPRQRAANQLNALRATGPRTQQGKRRSAVNATRHGLTVPVLSSWWGTRLPDLHALLCADGLDAHQAHTLAMCILDYERNVQHQRNRYLHSMGLPGSGIDPAAAGAKQRQMALAIQAQMPARGSPIPGVSRSAAQRSPLPAENWSAQTAKRRTGVAQCRPPPPPRRHALVRQCRSV